MKISDEISLSARNLLRRKGRTALTLVGVVIGTCMVVLIDRKSTRVNSSHRD